MLQRAHTADEIFERPGKRAGNQKHERAAAKHAEHAESQQHAVEIAQERRCAIKRLKNAERTRSRHRFRECRPSTQEIVRARVGFLSPLPGQPESCGTKFEIVLSARVLVSIATRTPPSKYAMSPVNDVAKFLCGAILNFVADDEKAERRPSPGAPK